MITNENVVTINSGKRRRMQVGVHVSTLDRYERKETSTGKPIIEIWFLNSQGNEQKKTLWIPSDNPFVKSGMSKEAAKEREEKEFVSQTTDILKAFFPIDEQVIKGETWEAYIKKFLTKLDKLVKSQQQCNVLVHYDTSYQHTEFPNYNWIRAFVEGGPHGFNLQSKYLRMKDATSSESYSSNVNSDLNDMFSDN